MSADKVLHLQELTVASLSSSPVLYILYEFMFDYDNNSLSIRVRHITNINVSKTDKSSNFIEILLEAH